MKKSFIQPCFPGRKSSAGFTIIGLLIIMGIVAVLATVTKVITNSVGHLQTTRDANRLTDLTVLPKPLSLFKLDNPVLFFGSSSIVYVSLPNASSSLAVRNESDQLVYNENNFLMYAYAASVGQAAFFIDSNKITGSDDFFWNNSTKRLGIGTAGPDYKLDVQGGQLNASGGLCIAGDCKTAWSQVQGTKSQVQGTNYWTASGNNIYNNNSGNVGIGTTDPQTLLHLSKTAGTAEQQITVGGDGTANLWFGNSNGINNRWAGIGLSGTTQGLYLTGNGVLKSGHMFISGDGNVGIGTTDPGSYKLNVAGTVSVNSGTNIVYRCTTAGTLPVGSLTINSGNCGASVDTGLSVN